MEEGQTIYLYEVVRDKGLPVRYITKMTTSLEEALYMSDKLEIYKAELKKIPLETYDTEVKSIKTMKRIKQ